MSRRATAQDVADLAGVSRSAVSLVLNGRAKGAISAAKQQAVLDAARRLEYTPNVVAQSLRTSRTRILGVLTWQGVGGLPLSLLASTLQTSLQAGYQLIKMYAEPTELDQHRALATMGTRQVDGMLVVSPALCEYHAVDALSAKPVVLLNCLDPDEQLPSVTPEEEGAGGQAAQLLVDAGHRDVGLISGSTQHYQTGLRVRGVQQALRAAGLPPASHQGTDVRVDAGAAAATALLTGEHPPTALVCSNERLAVGALFAAASLGLSVPDDLSVVSLDDHEQLATQLSPAVTLVERPDEAMAARAAELLIDRLESGERPEQSRYGFEGSVVVGGSVAAPASHRR